MDSVASNFPRSPQLLPFRGGSTIAYDLNAQVTPLQRHLSSRNEVSSTTEIGQQQQQYPLTPLLLPQEQEYVSYNSYRTGYAPRVIGSATIPDGPHHHQPLCFCASVPLEGGGGNIDVLIAVGMGSGALLIIRISESPEDGLYPYNNNNNNNRNSNNHSSGGGGGGGDVVATIFAPHISSSASASDSGGNAAAAAGENDAMTSISWMRGKPYIACGYQSGRVCWFQLTSTSASGSPDTTMLFLPTPTTPSTPHPQRRSGSRTTSFSLVHLATFPAYSSNALSAVISSEELQGEQVVVFGTATEILLFDVEDDTTLHHHHGKDGDGRYSTSAYAPSKGKRHLTSSTSSRAITLTEMLSRPRPSATFVGKLAKPLCIPRSAEYVSCHPYLSFFAVLSRGPLPPVAQSGSLQASQQSPLRSASPATTTTTNFAPLHIQIFEIRRKSTNNGSGFVGSACGPARLVRQSSRMDSIIDMAWRYSHELMLAVNSSEDAATRLYRFLPQPGESLEDRDRYSSISSPRAASVTFKWQERLVRFPSHAAVMNVEWMSAGSAHFDAEDTDAGLDRSGTAAALGFGVVSRMVGFSVRGELTILTVNADPVVSWCGDDVVVVGLGSSLCLFRDGINGSREGTQRTSPTSTRSKQHKSQSEHQPSRNVRRDDGGDATPSMPMLMDTAADTTIEGSMTHRAIGGFGIDAVRNAYLLGCPVTTTSATMMMNSNGTRGATYANTTTGGTATAVAGGGSSSTAYDTHHLLKWLFRYIACLESLGMCSPTSPSVPGLLDLLTNDSVVVPSNAQLLDRGVFSKSHAFSCPSSRCPGGGNDPRRVIFLYVFDWLPCLPAGAAAGSFAPLGGGGGPVYVSSSSSSWQQHQHQQQHHPWLTSRGDVERLVAMLLLFHRLEEAVRVLQVHQSMSKAFPPVATLLLLLVPRSSSSSSSLYSFRNDDDVDDSSSLSSTPMFDSATTPLMISTWEKMLEGRLADIICPELFAALTTLFESAISRATTTTTTASRDQSTTPPTSAGGIATTMASATSVSSRNGSASLVYDDPRLSIVDRMVIAMLRHPNEKDLDTVFRKYFIPSFGNNLVFRLLVEGIHDGTLHWMQRLVDSSGDVQLAACLFARVGLTATLRSDPGAGAAGLLWNRWREAYSLFLSERCLYVQRTQFDVQCKRLEASMHSECNRQQPQHAVPKTPNVAHVSGGGEVDATASSDCVCRGLMTHIPGGLPEVLAHARRCSMCGESMDRCLVVASGPRHNPATPTVTRAAGSPGHGAAAGRSAMTVASSSHNTGNPGFEFGGGACPSRAVGSRASSVPDMYVAATGSSTMHDPQGLRGGSGGAFATTSPYQTTLTKQHRTDIVHSLLTSAFTWCTVCGHGGHALHLRQWFEVHAKCPVDDCACLCNS